MKKFSIILCLLLALCVHAVAANPKIVDNADLLSVSEETYLESLAAEISDTYVIDVVILTVQSTNGTDAQEFADDYFDYHGYGIGLDHSGILLLLVMDSHEWVISTTGKAMDYISRSDADELFERISSDISAGRYFDGFSDYLSILPSYYENSDMGIAGVILISLLVGAAVGGIALLIMRSGMRTAKQQVGAGSYVRSDSYKLKQHLDFYLYSNTTRTRKESNDSSGSHRGSSGRSHGGSRGRF